MKKIGDIAENLCSSLLCDDNGIGELFLRWDQIIGEYFSSICSPVKLKKDLNVLLIKVHDPKRILEVQYKEEIILTKINNFLQKEKILRIKVSV